MPSVKRPANSAKLRDVQWQRSFKAFGPLVPLMPRPVRKSQAGVQQLLYSASELDPITYLILPEEMILDHLAQVRLRQEDGHWTSLC